MLKVSLKNKLMSSPTVPTVALCIGIDLSSYSPPTSQLFPSHVQRTVLSSLKLWWDWKDSSQKEFSLERKTQYMWWLCEQKEPPSCSLLAHLKLQELKDSNPKREEKAFRKPGWKVKVKINPKHPLHGSISINTYPTALQQRREWRKRPSSEHNPAQILNQLEKEMERLCTMTLYSV